MENNQQTDWQVWTLLSPVPRLGKFHRLVTRDFIYPEFILHTGLAFQSWFCDFPTSCLRQLKIPNIWRRRLIVVIPKSEKLPGTQRAIVPYLCYLSPSRSSGDSSTLVSKQSTHRSRRASDTEGRPYTRSPCRDKQAVEGVLSKNMATVGEYLQTSKLKLSTTKTVSAAFHLNNKEAKREQKVNINNETLLFCSEPKYLGVTLDRSITYRRHLESLRKKLTSRVALLKRLAGSGWGAGAATLGTATLVHSSAEYCTPVWCRSAYTHLIDPAFNDALRIVSGCQRPTPANNLPILAGIQPAELRHIGATLFLARRAMEPGDLLHSTLTRPSGATARRLISRHPFVPAAQQLISSSDNSNIRVARWADHQWNAEWLLDNRTRLRIFIPDTGTPTPGAPRPRRAWVRLNRLRTGVGIFRSCLYKWGTGSLQPVSVA